MDIPIIFPVRKQSQRCPNKVLRPFHQGLSILDIASEKFKNDPVFIAAHEPEFKDVADKYGIGFIQRTLESALSENVLGIHNYLVNLPYKYVCFVNVCCPLLKAESVREAIEVFKSDDEILSLFSVIESHDIIFNNQKEFINTDKVFNSKLRKPCFIGNNAFIIFEIERLFKLGSYWDYQEKDPYLFKTSKMEAVDIDTVEDFFIAQALYERHIDDTSV